MGGCGGRVVWGDVGADVWGDVWGDAHAKGLCKRCVGGCVQGMRSVGAVSKLSWVRTWGGGGRGAGMY